ncbi:hypothetical protein I4U23_010346 [Adineta vaga]|nr:hypothetical protein I4U23_010346 [Adineta vaga]
MTLRRLQICLNHTCFLENLIEHVPNLEEMYVQFHLSLTPNSSWVSSVDTLRQSNGNWAHKASKLRHFSLETFLYTDLEFTYLKWLLNNFDYVQKLQIHLKNDHSYQRTDQSVWKSPIDANFIRQYCLPDLITNLTYFNFYICSSCQLLFNDIEAIINSFKTHSYFLYHQWTNVKCLFDPITSYQHLFSSFTDALHLFNNLPNHSHIFNWQYIDHFLSDQQPSLSLCLKHFIELCPNISCITVFKKYGKSFNESDLLMSLEILSNMRQYTTIDMRFRNVTKIRLGTCLGRRTSWY